MTCKGTIKCGSLEAGSSGRWIRKGDPEVLLKNNMGAYSSAKLACEKLCSKQKGPGVCLYKDGWGGVCAYSYQGTKQDYKQRYGNGDTRHKAASCIPHTSGTSCCLSLPPAPLSFSFALFFLSLFPSLSRSLSLSGVPLVAHHRLEYWVFRRKAN